MAGLSSPEILSSRFEIADSISARTSASTLSPCSSRLFRVAVRDLLGSVPGLHELSLRLVVVGVLLGLALHPLDLVFGEAARAVDLDVVALARRLVGGGDVQDAVRVDREFHLDLRRAARRGRNAGQIELAEGPVVLGELAFALKDVDRHRALVVARGRERLLARGGNRRVPLDQRVITPPSVSTPSDSGVTSSRSTSFTSPCSTPPWIAAPIATTSSGLMDGRARAS